MNTDDKDVNNWQTKVLPFVIIVLSILLATFILLYLNEVQKIQSSFLPNTDYNVVNVSKNLSSLGITDSDKMYNTELISLLNRHYSASLIIKSRILIINLSFLTGMVLCFIGGLFVLGKFSEKATKFNVGQEKANLLLTSSSPGIVITFFGVCLIGISIFSKTSLIVEDKPVYLREDYNSNSQHEVNIDDSITKALIDSLKRVTNNE
ncbi:hypothetical protein V9K67_20610 [Paraflavisolibacter sp. H34]|uniref:hypothetical protein n=1 Tax=Huijunlia imazamoxiresistens TaxID=3127457 RepID=UPI003018A666